MFYSALTAFAALLLSAPALAGYISVWHFNGQYICELSDGVLQSCPLSGGVLVNGDSPSCNDLLNNGYGTEPNLFYEYPKTPDYFNGPCPCGGGMLDFYKRGDTFEVYWAGGGMCPILLPSPT
ncbi:uncharacterized protein I303_103324 [Kwoniella dejecticola CBS 10117]|uniref:Uncharacterized protein n=1 Tax=Kwoniella dejecticola CBS 10117 TaxID=1296121 RepID=A0A1A6A6F4_9TREE|nr:uncharacterized protein I303_03347 [Kwoniella dejecticola CBS 10117]OBR85636.1 hypothetical protein I303_03347 [Kwoniella dejecticola CBS 10117]